jgi:hypothetical protein
MSPLPTRFQLIHPRRNEPTLQDPSLHGLGIGNCNFQHFFLFPAQNHCKCRARGFDIRRARSISRFLSQQAVCVKSKGDGRNSERMRLSQRSDTCREKCQNRRHSAHRTVATESRVPCLQSVAVVSLRTRLWQRRCTVPGRGSNHIFEGRLFSPNRCPVGFSAVGGAMVADAAGTAFLAGSA